MSLKWVRILISFYFCNNKEAKDHSKAVRNSERSGCSSGFSPDLLKLVECKTFFYPIFPAVLAVLRLCLINAAGVSLHPVLVLSSR